MNIHPVFVHFPIALLVAYSVLELGAYIFPVLRRQAWLFPIKAFLLFTGVITAFTSLATGDIAEGIIEDTSPRAFIIETHSAFAVATSVLYLVLAAAYLNRVFDMNGWFDRIAATNGLLARGWAFKKRLAHLILDTWLLPLVVLAALVTMTFTGALGAAIVYGPDIDPVVSYVYHLFWIQ